MQNKLQLATASLPTTVQSYGITVSKSTRNYLIFVSLISEDGSMDGADLRDYAQSNLEQVLARVQGVGEVTTMGSQYAMRIWLNPDKLEPIPVDHLRRDDGAEELQRGSVGWTARRNARRARAAAELRHYRTEYAENARRIRRHSCAYEHRWLHCSHPRYCADGDGYRIVRYGRLL